MYFYVSEETGDRAGPVSAEVMAQYLISGECLVTTLVWQAGMSDWVPLSESPLMNELIALTEQGAQEEDEEEEEEEEVPRHYQQMQQHNPRHSAKIDVTGRRKSSAPADHNDPFEFGALQDELADSRDVFVSKVVYVEDEKNGWMTALVIAHNDGVYTVERLEDKRRVKVKGDLLLCNDQIAPDMSSMVYISEPACVFNLGARFVKGENYTSMGVALIAINPCKECPVPSFDDYAFRKSNLKNFPHPFATAQLSYDLMCFSNCSQSILMSGESGSGKSYTVQMILNYLVTRSYPADDREVNSFDQRLLCSSEVFEAFGHAKTQSTNNSSRFGKFLKLYYEDAQLTSAMVETFLLEKGRVLRLGEHERSFNIFYQLLAGKKSRHHILADFEHLILDRASSYELLTHSDCFSFPGCRDGEKFDSLVESMSLVGFTDMQIRGFLKIVCGLLHLGNIMFEADYDADGNEIAVVRGVSARSLEMAAESLEVDVYTLHSLLSQRKVRRLGVETATPISPLDAGCARDWTIKSIYVALFESLTHYLNLSLNNGEEHTEILLGSGKMDLEDDPATFIALVDTTGFGAYELNDFEHFLINYTSEALESTFCSQVFEAELNLFQDEEIDFCFSSDERPDNSDCIEMLSAKGKSILSILDTVCRMPDSIDDLFLQRIQTEKSITSSKYFVEVDEEDKAYAFKVRHYAAPVQYCCYPQAVELDMGIKGNAWVSRNNDLTPSGLSDVCKSSGLEELRTLPVHSAPDIKMSHNLSTSFKPSVASIVTNTVSDLNTLLMSTTCQYVRCLNPNEKCTSDYFDNEYVRMQMKALKIVQSCEVFKAGFSVRITFEQIREALGEELYVYIDSLFNGEREELLIACLLETYGLPHDAYLLGKSMVFFREDQLELIDALLDGPGRETEDQVALIEQISLHLTSARDAYAVADRVENESEDLSHAIDHVKTAASKMHERFALVESSPSALPGRVRALAAVVKTQKHIFDKVERMFKTASEFTSGCRFAADHCDVEAAQKAAETVGELFDQIIHQIKGLLSSIEKANASLAMIEADIADVEQLSDKVLEQAKFEMEFKVDQMSSMSEALLGIEREKSKSADQKRIEAEKALEARRVQHEDAEQRRKAAEDKLREAKGESERRLQETRKEAAKRDAQNKDIRNHLERQMQEMAADHEKQLLLRVQTEQSDREIQLLSEMADIEARLSAEKQHLERRAGKEHKRLQDEMRALENELRNSALSDRKSLLEEKVELERRLMETEIGVKREKVKLESKLLAQKSEAEMRLLEERARLIEEKKITEERLRLERLRLVDERQHVEEELAYAERALSVERSKGGKSSRKLEDDMNKLRSEKEHVEQALIEAESKLRDEQEMIEERMHQVEKNVTKRVTAEADQRLTEEKNAILEDKERLERTLQEIQNQLKAEQNTRHDKKVEARLQGEIARLNAEKTHVAKSLQQAESRLADENALMASRMREVERAVQKKATKEVNRRRSEASQMILEAVRDKARLLDEVAALEQSLAEADFAVKKQGPSSGMSREAREAVKKLEAEKEAILLEREELEEKLHEAERHISKERLGSKRRLSEASSMAAARASAEAEDEIIRLLAEKKHIEDVMQETERRARQELASTSNRSTSEKQAVLKRLNSEKDMILHEKESLEQSLREAEDRLLQQKSSSDKELEEKLAEKEHEMQAQVRRLLDEKTNLEAMLRETQERMSEEREVNNRRKSISATQKKELEDRMSAEMNELLAQQDEVQSKLLTAIVSESEIETEMLSPALSQPMGANGSKGVDTRSMHEELRKEITAKELELATREQELRDREMKIAEKELREREMRIANPESSIFYETPSPRSRSRLLAAAYSETSETDIAEYAGAEQLRLQYMREYNQNRIKNQEDLETELSKVESLKIQHQRELNKSAWEKERELQDAMDKVEAIRLQNQREVNKTAWQKEQVMQEEMNKLEVLRLQNQRKLREEQLKEKEAMEEEMNKLAALRLQNQRKLREEQLKEKEAMEEEMNKLVALKLQNQREVNKSALVKDMEVQEEMSKLDALKLENQRKLREEQIKEKEVYDQEVAAVEEIKLQNQRLLREAQLKSQSQVDVSKHQVEEVRLQYDRELRENQLKGKGMVEVELHKVAELQLQSQKDIREERLRAEQKLNEERYELEEQKLAIDAQARKEKLEWEAKMLTEKHAAEQERLKLEATNKESLMALEKTMRDEKLAFDAKLSEERHQTEQLKLTQEQTMRQERMALERKLLDAAADKEEFIFRAEQRLKEERAALEAKVRDERAALESKFHSDFRSAKLETENRLREEGEAQMAEAMTRAERERSSLQEEHERIMAEKEKRMDAKLKAMEKQLAEVERERNSLPSAEEVEERLRKEVEVTRRKADEEAKRLADLRIAEIEEAHRLATEKAITEERRQAREAAERAETIAAQEAEARSAMEQKMQQLEASHATERELADARAAMLLEESKRIQGLLQSQTYADQPGFDGKKTRQQIDEERRAKLAEYAMQRNMSNDKTQQEARVRAATEAEKKAQDVVKAERKAIEMERRALEAEKRSEEERMRAQQQIQDMERRMQEAAEAQERAAVLAEAERRALEAETRAQQAEQDVAELVGVLTTGPDGAPLRPPPPPGRRQTLSIKDLMAAKAAGRRSSTTGDAGAGEGISFDGYSIASAFADAELPDLERVECVEEMINFMRESCPSISGKDARQYANLFYDNRMKNMSRVARRYRDEPGLLTKLSFDRYDAEELLEGLRKRDLLEDADVATGALLAGRRSSQTGAQMADFSLATAALQAMAANAEKPVVIQGQQTDLNTVETLAFIKSELANIRRDSQLGLDRMQGQLIEISKDEAILKEKLLNRSSKHIDEALPPGWEAKIDKASQKTYYVNRTTKEKSWKRPKPLPVDEDLDGDGVADSDQIAPGGGLTEEAKARYRAEGRKFEDDAEADAASYGKSQKAREKANEKVKAKEKDSAADGEEARKPSRRSSVVREKERDGDRKGEAAGDEAEKEKKASRRSSVKAAE